MPDLKVDVPARTTLTIGLNPERINHFQDAAQIRFKSIFNTANQPSPVKIYSNYRMTLKMVGDFTYRLNN